MLSFKDPRCDLEDPMQLDHPIVYITVSTKAKVKPISNVALLVIKIGTLL